MRPLAVDCRRSLTNSRCTRAARVTASPPHEKNAAAEIWRSTSAHCAFRLKLAPTPQRLFPAANFIILTTTRRRPFERRWRRRRRRALSCGSKRFGGVPRARALSTLHAQHAAAANDGSSSSSSRSLQRARRVFASISFLATRLAVAAAATLAAAIAATAAAAAAAAAAVGDDSNERVEYAERKRDARGSLPPLPFKAILWFLFFNARALLVVAASIHSTELLDVDRHTPLPSRSLARAAACQKQPSVATMTRVGGK